MIILFFGAILFFVNISADYSRLLEEIRRNNIYHIEFHRVDEEESCTEYLIDRKQEKELYEKRVKKDKSYHTKTNKRK